MKYIISLALSLLIAPALFAHCDWIKGPVVADARTALDKNDLTPVLRWIAPKDEAEIRNAFTRTMAARSKGDAAREIADQWFFETVVRVHRASEGEAFTGLKGAEYKPEEGIELADHALEAKSLEHVEAALTASLRSELRKRYAEVNEAAKHANDSVDAGRHYVHAYAEFIHFVDGVHRTVAGTELAHHE
jgi:hypothetical protein